MFFQDGYLGSPNGVEDLANLNNSLNAKVLEQLQTSQELVMLNGFAKEANEYQFKQCLQERISDIASWHWVLGDLSKRLEEAIAALKYEHNALRVVVQRIQSEINEHSREASRPGALNPHKDIVEDVIMEEYNFLREEKKKFERMIPELDKQTIVIGKTKKRIDLDLINKQKALSIEETCASIDNNSFNNIGCNKRKKRRFSPVTRWENRCASLKRAGLRALSNAIISRQQVRGARVHLSIAAQAYAARVEAALRKRLHANTVKLKELEWQKEEAIRDIKALDEELIINEQNLLETMEQEGVIEARLADRTLRPAGEFTRDDVDRQLRDEISRLRHFIKHLRGNIARIMSLQNNITDTIAQIDCRAEDIAAVVRSDQDRMCWRLGEGTTSESQSSPPSSQAAATTQPSNESSRGPLAAIIEDDEENDYPFDNKFKPFKSLAW